VKQKSIGIIGGGIGGLAAAALLAKDGHKVTIFEKNEQWGGRMSLLQAKGFKFDMGPSWYLMPDVMERFFAQFDKKPSDFFKLELLNPQYRVFFADGTQVDITKDEKQVRKVFEDIEKGAGDRLEEYLAEAKDKYDYIMGDLFYKNADSVFDLLSVDFLRRFLSLDMLGPMHRYVARYFKDPKLQQILEYTLVFLGCSPYNAPALFSIMSHVDLSLKVWYPEGGMYKFIEALLELGEEYGVEYRLREEVSQIIVTDGRVTGLETNLREHAFDSVIGAGDLKHIEGLLSDQSKRMVSEIAWQKKTMAPSTFLLYLGVKKKLPKLAHHTFYFTDKWQKHFDQIFKHPEYPQEPSLYINVPSRTDSTVAPAAYENLMVLVPIASGLPETKKEREKYAAHIIAYIEQKTGVKFAKEIIFQQIFSVTDFESRYFSYKGNALGGFANTLFQTSIFRPNNRSKKLPNLFFVGAGTVPGIGVPTSLVSAHLVRERVEKCN